MPIPTFRRSLLATAIYCVLNPAISYAETAGGNAAAASGLEEVVVTGSYLLREDMDMATGLGLTPQETPQSVSVMTAQRIRDQQLDTIADVVVNAVGVSMDEVDDVRHTFYARGFEIENYQVDGVPLAWSLAGDSGETIADVAIYERVEVVRGATGLMTGAGDPSASINLVRKHASSTKLTGYVDSGISRWNNYQVTTDVGSGLGLDGALRGRVVAKYEAGDSYQDLYEDEKYVFYGVFEADLGADTLLRLGSSYQRNDPTSPTWGALPTWFSDGTRTDWSRSTTTAAKWTEWRTTNENYFVNLSHEFSNGWQLVGNYNRLENRQQTKLLYLYGSVDKETGEGLSSWPYKSKGKAVQDSYDMQLRGDYRLFEREHEFVLGALHSEQSADTVSFAEGSYPPVGNFFEWDGSIVEPDWAAEGSVEVDLDTQQDGVYAATRFAATDSLKLILGGRVAEWKRSGVDYGDNQDFGDDGVFIPYAGALYDLTDTQRLYVSYTEIFKPQNARDINGNFLDPSEGKSTEVGLKSAFLDNTLQTSIALFLVEQDNLAQPTGEFLPDSIEEAYYAAQGTETKGFELEAVGNITANWQFSAGYTQFEAEDADGTDVNTDQPRELLKLFTSYRLSGALQGLTVGGGVNWQDEISSNIENPLTLAPAKLKQDDYTLVSLMARYEFNEHLSAQVNADNVFDETYYSQVGFFDQYRYGTPMDYSLHVNYRF